jgi:hypothetical protein
VTGLMASRGAKVGSCDPLAQQDWQVPAGLYCLDGRLPRAGFHHSEPSQVSLQQASSAEMYWTLSYTGPPSSGTANGDADCH